MWRRVLDSPLARTLIVKYRLLARPRRVRVHGVVVAVDRNWPGTILGTLYDGRYERFEAQVLSATLRPDDRYFEVGAGIGVTTTIACQIVGEASVTAVEAGGRPRHLPARRHRGRRGGVARAATAGVRASGVPGGAP